MKILRIQIALWFFLPVANAELQSSISLTLGSALTTPSSNSTSLTSQTTTGLMAYGEGTSTLTYSNIIKHSLTTGSGRFSAFQGVTRYGMNLTSNIMLFQSFTSPLYFTTASAANSACPGGSTPYNWLLLRSRSADALVGQAMNPATNTFYAGGTMTYNTAATDPISIDTYFDLLGNLTSTPVTADGNSGDACDNAAASSFSTSNNSSAPWDSNGSIYFDTNRFVYVSSGGNPIVALGVSKETLTGNMAANFGAGANYPGLYTEYTNRSTQAAYNIIIVPNAAGTTLSLYSIANLAAPLTQTLLGTITLTSLDSPSQGFATGTYALNGVGGTGNVICEFSSSPLGTIACVAQKPSSTSVPITIVGTTSQRSVLAVSIDLPVQNIATKQDGNTYTYTATLTNLSGRKINTLTPSTPANFVAAGGTCGSSLNAYSSCTKIYNFVNSVGNAYQNGIYQRLYSVAYDDGSGGNVNGTALLTATIGLQSLAVVTSSSNVSLGAQPRVYAIATYQGGATQDVSSAVTWTSSAGAVASVNATNNVVPYSAGSTTFTASIGSVSSTKTMAIVDHTGNQLSIQGIGFTNGAFRLQIQGGKLIDSESSLGHFIFNALPQANQTWPDLLIGNSVIYWHNLLTQNGTSAAAYGSYYDGTHYFVADTNNHRILMWNSLPTASYQNADLVLGQSNFTSGSANAGGSAGQATLSSPYAVYSDSTHVFVADYGNNRVMMWNSMPTANNQNADYVLGQANFSTVTTNTGGRSAGSLSGPVGVSGSGTNVFVADGGNARALIWNTIPTANGQVANVEVGQANMSAYSTTASQNGLRGIWDAIYDGTHFIVSDGVGNRVLVWTGIPTANAQNANLVLGQPNFNSATANNGGTSALTMNTPYGIASDGTHLFVGDYNNGRILGWTSFPTANQQAADFQIGNYDWAGHTPTSSNIFPNSVMSDGQHFITNDPGNGNRHRVLISNNIPTMNNTGYDIALGQPDLTTTAAPAGPTSQTISNPGGAASDGTNLFVVDGGYHRVLIWTTFPTVSYQAANLVIGQPNMTTATPGTTQSTVDFSYSTPTPCWDGQHLFVPDPNGHRILIWNNLPTANGQNADLVLGQTNFTSSGSGVTQSKLYAPNQVSCDGTHVFVTDLGNNRVLIWNSIPTANGQNADVVLGQTLFSTRTVNNGGVSLSSMNSPYSVATDGTRLIVADTNNSRLLVWNSIPTSNGTAANAQIGQISSVVSAVDPTYSLRLGLSYPYFVSIDGESIWVASGGANGNIKRYTLSSVSGNSKVGVAYVSFTDGSSYAFGSTAANNRLEHLFQISNTGTSPVTSLSGNSLSAPFAFKGGSFPGTNGTCSSTLNPGSSCSIDLTFAPVSNATSSSTLTLTYNDGNISNQTASISISGVAGTANVTITGTAGFGNVNQGTTSAGTTLTLTNSGTIPANGLGTVPSITLPFEFKGGVYPGTGGTCTNTIPASNGTCTVVVDFKPTTVGFQSQTLKLIYYTGTAWAVAQFGVNGTGI